MKFSFNKFNQNTRVIGDIIEQYRKLTKSKAPQSSINIEDLIKDKCTSDGLDYHVFNNPVVLENFRQNQLDSSSLLLKLGKANIWRPKKFKKTKMSDVADTIDEISR